jgi:uncharacterized protein
MVQTGTALITGASSGIGAVYADRLARRGHDLVLVARDRPKLEALTAKLARDTGRRIEVLPADLTDAADLRRVEARLRADAAIAMLVNNAGMSASGTLADADPDRLEAMVRLNAIAPMRLAAAAVSGFLARGGGTVVLNLSQSLQQEVGGKGVRVQAVLPGATRTAIWEKAGVDTGQFPAGMLMGVEEMVDAALAGLDQGEAVTIPSLPDAAEWERFNAARLALGPKLSRDRAAGRYRQ